jgi:hypothetical protein
MWPLPRVAEGGIGMKIERSSSSYRIPGRIEVWLFAAIAAVGLLGFISTLSSGDIPSPVARGEFKAPAYVQPEQEE